MDIVQFDKLIKEIKYEDNLVRMIRWLLFFCVDIGESRDRLALVVLARHTKDWLNENPGRIKLETLQVITTFANEIIKAGIKSDGPEMPPPLEISVTCGE